MLKAVMRRGIVVAMVLAVAAAAAAQQKVDVTGTWLFDVQTGAGGGTPTVTLKQDGEKLSGHYSSQTFGEVDLTGTVKGDQIAFSFTADVQGTSVPVSYAGTVESNTAMKGTISITGVGDGTFTAKKK